MAQPRPFYLLLTCEHGGKEVPASYRKLFAKHHKLLATHRGWDPGTKQLAQKWQRHMGCQLVVATVTRLLVDLNRSPNHPQVFSEITRELPEVQRSELLSQYHAPHRTLVQNDVRSAIQRGQRVLHIGVHSFTPVLNGEVRNCDIGLLYDPRRPWERELCHCWRTILQNMDFQPRVRMNYPYRGTSDGLTTTLRKRFDANDYAGIELEVNQKFPLAGGQPWQTLQQAIIASSNSLLLSTSNESHR